MIVGLNYLVEGGMVCRSSAHLTDDWFKEGAFFLERDGVFFILELSTSGVSVLVVSVREFKIESKEARVAVESRLR